MTQQCGHFFLDVDDDVSLAQLFVEARILALQLFHFVCQGMALGLGARVSAESRPPESPEFVLVANSPAARSTDLRDGEARRCRRGWRQPPPLRAGCALCIPRGSYVAGVGPRLRGPDARRPAGLRPGLALHCAAARYARLRFVPRQPRPLRQHQQNSCSSLFFSSSPCSLITTTGSVSEILARRAIRWIPRQSLRSFRVRSRPQQKTDRWMGQYSLRRSFMVFLRW
jgi:hypothetical protein